MTEGESHDGWGGGHERGRSCARSRGREVTREGGRVVMREGGRAEAWELMREARTMNFKQSVKIHLVSSMLLDIVLRMRS